MEVTEVEISEQVIAMDSMTKNSTLEIEGILLILEDL